VVRPFSSTLDHVTCMGRHDGAPVPATWTIPHRAAGPRHWSTPASDPAISLYGSFYHPAHILLFVSSYRGRRSLSPAIYTFFPFVISVLDQAFPDFCSITCTTLPVPVEQYPVLPFQPVPTLYHTIVHTCDIHQPAHPLPAVTSIPALYMYS
jgi:hypothetical protein